MYFSPALKLISRLLSLHNKFYLGKVFDVKQLQSEVLSNFWTRGRSQITLTKGKKLKNLCIDLAIFQHFSFGPPLETMKKKVVKRRAEII